MSYRLVAEYVALSVALHEAQDRDQTRAEDILLEQLLDIWEVLSSVERRVVESQVKNLLQSPAVMVSNAELLSGNLIGSVASQLFAYPISSNWLMTGTYEQVSKPGQDREMVPKELLWCGGQGREMEWAND